MLVAICLLLAPIFATAQKDVRTTKTKVADLLVLLPAQDSGQAARVYKQLVGLDAAGLATVAALVRPNGQPEGVAARYAVSLLTHTATSKAHKAKIEMAWLAALKKPAPAEVKAYFITNLQLIGSDVTVPALIGYLGDSLLAEPAIAALVALNSPAAKKALLTALPKASGRVKPLLAKALGSVKYPAALPAITKLAAFNKLQEKKQALWAISQIADASSYPILLQQAKNAGFKQDSAAATEALVEYMHQMAKKGNAKLATRISAEILAHTTDASQQYTRLAALQHLPADTGTLILINDLEKFDSGYRRQVLALVEPMAKDTVIFKAWHAAYLQAEGVQKAEILSMLARTNPQEPFIDQYLLPALASDNAYLRKAAADAIAANKNPLYIAQITGYLLSTQGEELANAQDVLLRMADSKSLGLIAAQIDGAKPAHKVALLKVLSKRRASSQFATVARFINDKDSTVRTAVLEALPNVSEPGSMAGLLSMLAASKDAAATKAIQAAIISAIAPGNEASIDSAFAKYPVRLLPVLPFTSNKNALQKVMASFNGGNELEKATAFAALEKWQGHGALRTLLGIIKDNKLPAYHARAFAAYISQVEKSNWPEDQKLLMLQAVMPYSLDAAEKRMVLKAIGGTRTFLALMYVAKYINDEELGAAASRSAMQIALPTGDGLPGLEGAEVRKVLEQVLDKLTGADSQYEKIDIQTYLAKMPYTRGYEPIFNGRDLTGWQGLVENPIARSKMSKEELAQKQKIADEKLKANWSVKDGAIWFTGDGDNLCTIKKYADFELLADWMISKEGDSGFYLRGSPQVQIWDTSRTGVGAQVGSGGLYNNVNNPSKPLVLADNAIGEWNTFRIKMVGDRVTVYLNGVLVVDNVLLENYWDRKLPIFSSEAIELQAHGTDLAFRNIYVKELGGKPYELSEVEKAQKFELLFNEKDLNQWKGNKTDYVVEDNAIAIYPGKEGHGNLYTKKEYGDFIFRFSFQLTPGANNGIGIHTPDQGDAAYVGKEIQVLDNDAPVYANLEAYQYHGSVYGVIPAKRGFLKPIGEWNEQEIYVKGDSIRVTLNGTVILEGDMKKASANGTLDKKDHPGLLRHKGHIAFLGHGSVVKFKDVRIKSL